MIYIRALRYLYIRICMSVCEGCEYGDRADWCSSYVRGESECLRPDVAAQCCRSCERYIDTNGASNTRTSGRPLLLVVEARPWHRGASTPDLMASVLASRVTLTILKARL